MSEESRRRVAVCAGCHILSPETATPYTLIHTFRWRATRTKNARGKSSVVWRCPECWRRQKTRLAE
jgi:hypothetical protein